MFLYDLVGENEWVRRKLIVKVRGHFKIGWRRVEVKVLRRSEVTPPGERMACVFIFKGGASRSNGDSHASFRYCSFDSSLKTPHAMCRLRRC